MYSLKQHYVPVSGATDQQEARREAGSGLQSKRAQVQEAQNGLQMFSGAIGIILLRLRLLLYTSLHSYCLSA